MFTQSMKCSATVLAWLFVASPAAHPLTRSPAHPLTRSPAHPLTRSPAHPQVPTPTTTFLVERLLNKVPRDIAMTPNGSRTLVRANYKYSPIPNFDDEISLWDNRTGTRITISCTHEGFGQGQVREGYASDAIAITNDIAVVLGEYQTIGTASEPLNVAIDVLRISGSTPTCLKHITWGGSQTPPVMPPAGRVSDVAITPDGAFAVVHCRNYIFVVPLGNDASDPHFMFDISPIPFGAPPEVTFGTYPGPQSDSVAVTNTHAVVLTTRDNSTLAGALSPHAWVYILDLTTLTPQIVLEQSLIYTDFADEHPHDVAITPNGNVAVVTTNSSAAAFNLRGTPALIAHVQAQPIDISRSYSLLPRPVDSVELTDQYAALLSMEGTTVGTQSWVLEIFKLVDASGAPAFTFASTIRANQLPNFLAPDWPHDLAIWTNGATTRAVVKSADSDVVVLVSDISTIQNRQVLNAAPYHPQSEVFVSDSIVIGAYLPISPSLHRALTIGSKLNVATSRYEGTATAIFMNFETSPFAFENFVVADPDFDTFPSDVALGRSGWDAVVRCMAPPDEVNPALGGRDFMRYVWIPPPAAEQVRYGGSGDRIWALDSNVYGLNSAVSISEYALATVPSPGRIHFTVPIFQ